MTNRSHLFYYDPATIASEDRCIDTDVCVYGGTSAGVIAAIQVRRMGRRAVILQPGAYLGGLSSGGLSFTDFGNQRAIGGMAREFYRRMGRHYGVEEEWLFEPHVAEMVLEAMVREARVPVYRQQFLQRVCRCRDSIASIELEGGLRVRASVFIDASYEGDLMARAGVPYTVGREGSSQYGESLNGVQIRQTHQFEHPVDPYVVPGNSRSGLLPGISSEPAAVTGTGDERVQAYNFRLCLTRNPANRVPFEKPSGYDPSSYELLARYLATGWNELFLKFDPIRGDKVDMNNHGAVSSDFIGMNHAYPDADYPTRERIFQAHVAYQKGLLWFLANDRRVPEVIRTEAARWGLTRDEFIQTGGWSPQLYVREARRMISDAVITEHHCLGRECFEDGIGLGSYNMDSHNCQRFVRDGCVFNEGDVQVGLPRPYAISYRAIVPPKGAGTCTNLLVPVCLSASHIAYGSVRMEPVFMILGQSAGTAAVLAMDHELTVQDVPYGTLREYLVRDRQVLHPSPGKPDIRRGP